MKRVLQHSPEPHWKTGVSPVRPSGFEPDVRFSNSTGATPVGQTGRMPVLP